ncbi:Isotocin-neurophysin IT 2 [Triplophysa tibetana]|uniref:Isotocin-neurophysin IT 2 n=1 Tax=Triplophysa tibetana TaxID=1572043 RepID=A0A5A9P149_9TELE|nr:Isotocin-neurophysin IT 2 [Triplophysa tibetana]
MAVISLCLSMSAGLLSVLCVLSVCSACYISNCPIGGKRALQDFPARQCMSCGPDDRGRCFGPSICCGEGMGCLMGSPETLHCLEEDFLPSPCEVGGKVCGYEGRCAAPGVCCDSDGCSLDQSCAYTDGDGTTAGHQDLLLKLLHLTNHAHPYRPHQ